MFKSTSPVQTCLYAGQNHHLPALTSSESLLFHSLYSLDITVLLCPLKKLSVMFLWTCVVTAPLHFQTDIHLLYEWQHPDASCFHHVLFEFHSFIDVLEDWIDFDFGYNLPFCSFHFLHLQLSQTTAIIKDLHHNVVPGQLHTNTHTYTFEFHKNKGFCRFINVVGSTVSQHIVVIFYVFFW